MCYGKFEYACDPTSSLMNWIMFYQMAIMLHQELVSCLISQLGIICIKNNFYIKKSIFHSRDVLDVFLQGTFNL